MKARGKKILALLCALVLVFVLLLLGAAWYFGLNVLLWIFPPQNSYFTLQQEAARISVSLNKVASGYSQPTDIRFVPGRNDEFVVTEQYGKVRLGAINTEPRTLFEVDVLTRSEQGLLGLAFHLDFPSVPCVYINYVAKYKGEAYSHVAEWCTKETTKNVFESSWEETRVFLRIKQPYSNHNAGHLLFDPQGNLYLPWGDGGAANDPHGNGQNIKTFLGSVLRIKPTAPRTLEPLYTIPEDNPFIAREDVADEVYAWGFRNPWRASFDSRGRLVVGDVGQDKWEEITFVVPGGNHGWNIFEGAHCFKGDCSRTDTVSPVIEYGREGGRSVTGGYEALSNEVPELKGKYLFGDYVSGQLWAAQLPEKLTGKAKVYSLGQWPIFPATFGRDHQGRVYLADYVKGNIFRIEKGETEQTNP